MSPGDSVMTVNPEGEVINWEDMCPGMTGVVVSMPYTPVREDSTAWADAVDVRFLSCTHRIAIPCLRKLASPPADELVSLDSIFYREETPC